jgi:hypothetical protein
VSAQEIIRWVLRCDRPGGCVVKMQGFPDEALDDVRDRAAGEYGWTYDGEHDLCGDHSPEDA